jgi:hypothetical protein
MLGAALTGERGALGQRLGRRQGRGQEQSQNRGGDEARTIETVQGHAPPRARGSCTMRTAPHAIIAAKRAACKWSNARIGMVAGARYIRQKQAIDAIFAFCARGSSPYTLEDRSARGIPRQQCPQRPSARRSQASKRPAKMGLDLPAGVTTARGRTAAHDTFEGTPDVVALQLGPKTPGNDTLAQTACEIGMLLDCERTRRLPV